MDAEHKGRTQGIAHALNYIERGNSVRDVLRSAWIITLKDLYENEVDDFDVTGLRHYFDAAGHLKE